MTSIRYQRLTPRKLAGFVKRAIQRRWIRWKRRHRELPDGAVRNLPPLPTTSVVLGIGPANYSGQAWAWARAVERCLDDVGAEVFAVQNEGLNFPADRPLDSWWVFDRRWQKVQKDRVLNGYTHVLAEALRPVFGLRHGDTIAADLPVLRRAAKPVALLLHGSEIRRPDLHARRNEFSPFHDTDDELHQVLQKQSERLGKIVEAFLDSGTGPVYVSTPDLLDDVPRATWLPVVVDAAVWHSDLVPMERARPVVVHVPSRSKMKGSDQIDHQVRDLADTGLIEYRRYEGVPPEDMPGLIAQADIVLDQFALGSYGVSAVQAMAAGRVTVGHVSDEVRERVGTHLPIVEATPRTLVAVLEQLVADRDAARAVAAEGQRFAQEVHDGRRSAAVLAAFLGRPLRVG